jgi:phosphohistidine phosphatase SixA
MLRLVLMCLAVMLLTPAAATEAGWELLREGGHVVLIRHAMSPGTGDPANFDINDCSTQRGLSEQGRQQADRIGTLISVRGAKTEKLLSSRYCRCLDTARFAFDDREPEIFAALDPLPADPVAAKAQQDEIIARVKSYSGSGNLLMITHKDVIQALTGVSAHDGEAVIVKADGDKLHVLGKILFN